MKVQHPDFPDLVRDVPNGKTWLAAGWVEVKTYLVGEKRPELPPREQSGSAAPKKRAPKKRA